MIGPGTYRTYSSGSKGYFVSMTAARHNRKTHEDSPLGPEVLIQFYLRQLPECILLILRLFLAAAHFAIRSPPPQETK
jgi:hypothetical protein